MVRVSLVFAVLCSSAAGFQLLQTNNAPGMQTTSLSTTSTRRDWFSGIATMAGAITLLQQPQEAQAIGPVRIDLLNPVYTATPCPKDKPIPGEKAMKGMRPMCVNVQVSLENQPDKDLEKVGVYGFVSFVQIVFCVCVVIFVYISNTRAYL